MFSNGLQARPYAGVSGLAASADSAATAGSNPAGMSRLSGPAYKLELVLVQSESEWEGRLGDGEREVSSDDSTTIVVPSGYLVRPINEDFTFGFTMLGFGYSRAGNRWYRRGFRPLSAL